MLSFPETRHSWEIWPDPETIRRGQGRIKVRGYATPEGVAFHRLGALHTGPVYSGSAGSCSGPVPLAASAPTYDIGPAVDPLTLFTALTTVDL